MTYTEIIKSVIDSNITSYQIAKAINVPVQTIDRYRNGSLIENMKLGIAEKIVKYWEELNMTLEERILKSLAEMDEEIRGGLYDVYLESNGNLWFVDSGMAYDGDDKSAKEIGQVEDGEIINLH
ncbi:hypothetical protein ACWOBH_00030 [Globicatella sanguinis]